MMNNVFLRLYKHLFQKRNNPVHISISVCFIAALRIFRISIYYNYPYYAPFSCTCVAAGGSGENYRVFTSDSQVHCADGGLSVITFVVMHDNNPIANVGDHFTQGDLIGHTGTAGAGGTTLGDHMHLNMAWGGYAGWTPTTHGAPYYELTNSVHIYDITYVNDTTLDNPLSYNWRTYTGPTPPPPTPEEKKHRFPWVLYARKFRKKYTFKIIRFY